MSKFACQPPAHSEQIKVSFPTEHAILITFNRPKSLNAMTPKMTADVDAILTWVDSEPSLWVTIITGEGRVFCAGADLIAWNKSQQNGQANDQEYIMKSVDGFGSISRRSTSPKPIIAAVNGSAYGGGVEILLNCDIVIASEDATFALPEVKRGVIAAQGVIPRLARVAGHQMASEMLLLGRNVPAPEAATRFGFVNKVVPKADVLNTAIDWARQIIENSPDSVQSTKRALLLANQKGSVEDVVTSHTWTKEADRHYKSENIKEGLRAFAEKRKPVWTNPAKL